MNFHEVTSLFPLLAEADLQELASDIAAHGLREPLWTHHGQIIDGRNRFRACQLAGVEPHFREWDGSGRLLAFVVSLNLHRRHLSQSQRAMIAAKLATMRQGERTDLCPVDGLQSPLLSTGLSSAPVQPSENFPKVNPKISQAEAAQLLNVSDKSLRSAKHVYEHGAPTLTQAVESGTLAVSSAAALADLPVDQQQQVVTLARNDILKIAAALRRDNNAKRRAERVQQFQMTSPDASVSPQTLTGSLVNRDRFPLLYADPPWQYRFTESPNREVENHYPTLSLPEICALPVQTITATDCVLFLWATSPKLAEALQVIPAWGFSYKTCMIWVKDKIGLGYYARQQHELLLIATKGHPPPPLPANRPPSVVCVARTRHSAKPIEFYELIETMYPIVPKVELFARNRRVGWASWGNQVPTESCAEGDAKD